MQLWPVEMYPGFLLYRGTYDSGPVSDQTKIVNCVFGHFFLLLGLRIFF